VMLRKGFGTYYIDASNVFFESGGRPCTYNVSTVNESYGFRCTISLYAMIAVILFFISFRTVKERITPLKTYSTIGEDFKDLMHNRPWIVLFIVGVCVLSFVSVRSGSLMFYFTYFVGNKYLATGFMVVGTIAAILGTMLTGWFTKKMGKITAFMVLMSATAVFSAYFYFLNPTQILGMFIVQFLISFASAPITPIMWAMYADTADYSEKMTGRRATGLIFSSATASQKLGWTVGSIITTWLLVKFGYQANMVQTADTIQGLRLMMSWIPCAFCVLAAIVIIFYRLNAKKVDEIESELNRLREPMDY